MSLPGANCRIPILYEDNHILVVEKPVNMPTQEDESGDMDMLRTLKEHIKQTCNKPGNVYLGLVHRLDRPVGGVMVFARTSKAASRLSESVRTRNFHKTYVAAIHGKPDNKQDRLTHYLYKDTRNNIVNCVSKDHPEAKEAILDYIVMDYAEGLSLVNVRLHTGRSHQIRVQFATIGCPLYGDQKYGIHMNKAGQQIALWSMQIEFEHPTLKNLLKFTSPPPETYPWTVWSKDDFIR